LIETSVLRAGDSILHVRSRGAEPVGWSVDGRELLWPGGTAWARSSPILFPIVGRAAEGRIRVGDASYAIGTHGFAADEAFVVTSSCKDALSLRLSDTASTRAQYPFAFELEVSYLLTPRDVTASFQVSNPGDTAMPYALGFHPGFRWPFSSEAAVGHLLEFEEEEAGWVPEISDKGLFTNRRRAVPLDGRQLAITPDLMSREALCFLDAKSTSLRFVAPSGEAIAVETTGFPHLALWSRPPAPFLCMECWTGHGDKEGYRGELADKPSMRILAAGASARHAVRWHFENPCQE